METENTEVAVLKNGTHVFFNRGRFDNFCVCITTPLYNVYKDICVRTYGGYGPLDVKFFTKVKEFGRKHGPDKIYNDFLNVYMRTGTAADPAVVQLIAKIADTYGPDRDYMEIIFILLYAMMIAENNRPPRMPLKKKLKRLAMYQLLKDNPPKSPEYVANFTKRRRVGEIVPALAHRNLYI